MEITKFIKKLFVALGVSLVVLFMAYMLKELLSIIKNSDFSQNLIFFQPDFPKHSTLQFISKFKDHTSENVPIDSNIIIINIESPNAFLKRGEMASVIRFLKDEGAKTIAMDIALDISSTQYNPNWDREFADALRYAGNVISIDALNTFQNESGEIDTVLALHPIPIFDTVLADIGYANLDPPYSLENPGAIVQYFYPNQDFKGKMRKSFPMSVIYNFDRSKTLPYINYIEKIYNNFYTKNAFTIWDLSLLNNPETRILFQEYIKNKLFIFGYINPEEDPLKTSMFTTPIGKLDYVLVYAGIINDILMGHYKAISILSLDYLLGIFLIFFNLMYFYYSRNSNFRFKVVLNILLLPLETGILCLLLTMLYFYFNILISVVIPFLTVIISIPLSYLLFYRLEIPFRKIYISYKNKKLPYLFYNISIEPYKHNNNLIRYFSMMHNFNKMVSLVKVLSCLLPNQQNGQSDNIKSPISKFNDLSKEIGLNTIEELKKFNIQYSDFNINENLFSFLNSVKKTELIDDIILNQYENLFLKKNLLGSMIDTVSHHSQKIPKKMTSSTKLYHEFTSSLSNCLKDYIMIYIANKNENKYLIRNFKTSNTLSEYFISGEDLQVKEIYLIHKDTIINLNPFLIFNFCPYHHKKEIFIFSGIEESEDGSKKKYIYLGNNFSCRLEVNI